MLSVRQVRHGNTITVVLIGELTAKYVDVARRAFRWAAEDAEILDGLSTVVVVELGEVTSVDDAGVQALTALGAAVRSVPARLSLKGAQPAILRAVETLAVGEPLPFDPLEEGGVTRDEGL